MTSTAAQRILVVDDEAPLLMTLVANLELEGFDVMEARSGEQALELIESNAFDLVLSDIRMPGISGVDLCRKVRERHPDLPVILMTAFTVEGLVKEALTDGALVVIPKPFAVEHLIRMLYSAMHRPVILVVDDAVEVADTMAAALSAVGLPTRAVHDGPAALDVFRAGDVGVCVVDMVMPGMNGPDLIDQLRRIDPSVVVIAISGYDVEELFRRVASQADTIMRKPIDPADLLQAIAGARLRSAARAR
jgi:CheY-like chemotaxis protein